MSMNPPPGLEINAYFSQGDWEGFCNVKWTSPSQPADAFYRVEYHEIASGNWIWLTDVPPGEGDVYGVPVKFATAPAGGTPKTRTVDQVKITAMDVAGVEDPASDTIDTPALTPAHEAASNFAVVCSGRIGDENGALDITWDDHSQFISNGRIILTKYGLTSPGIQRVLYDYSFNSKPSAYGPNLVHIPIELLPPGITLESLEWDKYNPPSSDPRAPFWVVEGDLLTLSIVTSADGDITTKVAEFTFEYHREARIEPVVDSATKDMAYSKVLQVVQDPHVPVAITAGISYLSGLPAGLSFDGGTLTISGTPTALGDYEALFEVGSDGGKNVRQSVFITVTPEMDTSGGTWPIIVAPPPTVVLTRGEPYPPEFNLQAPGDGAYTVVSGTLPAGVTLDTATGIFSGTPTAVEAAHNVVFKKLGETYNGPNYTVAFKVVQGATPTILTHL